MLSPVPSSIAFWAGPMKKPPTNMTVTIKSSFAVTHGYRNELQVCYPGRAPGH